MRAIALALVVMVPSASLAHGAGPSDDAPVVERAPSARLLPADRPSHMIDPAPERPLYSRPWFWATLGFATALTIAALAVGILFVELSQPVRPASHPTPCMPGPGCGIP